MWLNALNNNPNFIYSFISYINLDYHFIFSAAFKCPVEAPEVKTPKAI